MAVTDDQKLQIVKIIADNTGWRGADLATAVAIAIRESGLRPEAFNGNTKTGDESWGLFQLNTLGGLWSRFQKMGFTDKSQLADPAANARAAYELWKTSKFGPWLGYRPGLTVAPQQAQAESLVQQAGQAGYITDYVPPSSMTTGVGRGVPLTTGAGGRGPYATSATAGPNTTGGTIEETAQQLYGYLAAYLTDPEVGPILRQAAAENWSPARLQGALYATDWWKTTQASARVWDANYAQDPATVNGQIQQQMQDIQAQASRLGFTIDAGHLHDLARDSLRMGWDQTQIANAIGAESFRDGRLSTSTTAQNVRTMASDYGIPMSDGALNDWSQRIATGQSTTEDLRQTLVGQASGLFPGLADQLAKGLTVKQLGDPFAQQAARTLNIDPQTVDFSKPQWNAALNGVDDKGVRRALTLSEWDTKLKSDATYGWQKTPDALAQSYAFAANLGKEFGRTA